MLLNNHRQIFSFCIKKRLYVHQGNVENHNGIRATIFGATGLMGQYVAGYLGYFGSQLVLPFNEEFNSYVAGDNIRELKNTAKPGNVTLMNGLNLKNQKMIESLVSNSNVVINLLGPRTFLRRHQQQKFDFINIEASQRIAEACKKMGVLRLVQFSAVGADQNSPSADFRTKAIAEKRVLDIFPDATIIRPCPIYGLNDYFASNIERQLYMFANRAYVTDDLTSKKQPINCKDVAIAVMNALKMQQSKGKTYELGGPHVLQMKQVYEIIVNMMKVKPKLYYINPQWIYWLTDRIYNWQFLSGQFTTKRALDLVVNESGSVGTIKDLYVQPVAFKDAVSQVLMHSMPMFGQTKDDDYR